MTYSIIGSITDGDLKLPLCSSQAPAEFLSPAADALVLADFFKRADEKAGDLAADGDQSRGRGVMCEQAFDTFKPSGS